MLATARIRPPVKEGAMYAAIRQAKAKTGMAEESAEDQRRRYSDHQ
jgi:hypothetical protein